MQGNDIQVIQIVWSIEHQMGNSKYKPKAMSRNYILGITISHCKMLIFCLEDIGEH